MFATMLETVVTGKWWKTGVCLFGNVLYVYLATFQFM